MVAIAAKPRRDILSRHGIGRAKLDHQLPEELRDFALVPKIIKSPDSIALASGKNNRELDVIEYRKDLGDVYVIFEEIRDKRGLLALNTMRKIKK